MSHFWLIRIKPCECHPSFRIVAEISTFLYAIFDWCTWHPVADPVRHHSINGERISREKSSLHRFPQWFVPKGLKGDYFNHHYSEQHVYDWLSSLKKVSDTDQYYAERLLDYSKVKENSLTEQVLNEVKSGKIPTDWQKNRLICNDLF